MKNIMEEQIRLEKLVCIKSVQYSSGDFITFNKKMCYVGGLLKNGSYKIYQNVYNYITISKEEYNKFFMIEKDYKRLKKEKKYIPPRNLDEIYTKKEDDYTFSYKIKQ